MKIAVHGAKGKLGAMICNQDVSTIAIERNGPVDENCVVIDVTSAVGVSDIIKRLNGQPLLIGSTGDLPWKEIKAYSEIAPVAVVPNFSVGIPLLIDILSKAIPNIPDDWDIEIVEAHHNQKRDAPSGTAIRLAKSIANANGKELPPMHSLRVGDTFGEHTVWLSGPGERIEIKHVATGRAVFAIGAIRWAKWLANQPIGLIAP